VFAWGNLVERTIFGVNFRPIEILHQNLFICTLHRSAAYYFDIASNRHIKNPSAKINIKMKVPSLAVTALTLLANPGGVVASSSSSAGAPASSSSSSRKSKVLPWTRAKVYNPVGGDSNGPESHVLLGQGEEASESLSVSIPLSQSSTLSANDAPLTRDIEMLTEILSDLVLNENEKVHELCQEFIDYGRQRCVLRSKILFESRKM
jgi:hypothetical protein